MKVDFELIDSILKDHSYDATQVIGIMQDIQKEYRDLNTLPRRSASALQRFMVLPHSTATSLSKQKENML